MIKRSYVIAFVHRRQKLSQKVELEEWWFRFDNKEFSITAEDFPGFP